MNAHDRSKYIEKLIDSCLGLLADKGAEYSRGEEDVNSNFKRVAASVGSDPVTVAYVYMAKHLDSIANYVKTRETPSGEPIEGRIHDAINYLAILGSLIEESKDVPEKYGLGPKYDLGPPTIVRHSPKKGQMCPACSLPPNNPQECVL